MTLCVPEYRELHIFDESGKPIPIMDRGGCCFGCYTKAICKECLDQCCPKIFKPKAEDENDEDFFKSWSLWKCPSCSRNIKQKLHFADELMLHYEKLSSKDHPIMVTIDFDSEGKVFLGLHEFFVLIYLFGGVLCVLLNGNKLLQLHFILIALVEGVSTIYVFNINLLL